MQLENCCLGRQRSAGRSQGWLEDVLVELLGVCLRVPYLRDLDDTIYFQGAVHDQTERVFVLDVYVLAHGAIHRPVDLSLHDPENGHSSPDAVRLLCVPQRTPRETVRLT